LEPDSDADIRG